MVTTIPECSMIFYHLPIYLQSPLIKSALHNDCFEVILERDIFLKDDCSRKKCLEKKRQFSQKWISTFLLFRGCFKSPLLALNAPLQSSPQVHFWTMIFVILICTTLQWILTQTMNMWLKKRLSVLIQVIKKIIPLGIILIFTHSLPFSEAQK